MGSQIYNALSWYFHVTMALAFIETYIIVIDQAAA